MALAVHLNGPLERVYNVIDGMVITHCQRVQGGVVQRVGIGNLQGLIQVTLRNMVYMGDVGNGHPGTNGSHITCSYERVLLLKLLVGLEGCDCTEGCYA